jgi:hypothetical protein
MAESCGAHARYAATKMQYVTAVKCSYEGDRQRTYERHIESRSYNHCCSEKFTHMMIYTYIVRDCVCH